ncbi:MAG: hypothetical protein ACJ0BD_02295 [Gammaproteobacteria bacterium]|tara:strand:- start:433 stop:867 length:435 start_codon:yes stop_codon:yes gene_type:complete
MEIILKDGTYYEIEQDDLLSWQRTYTDCNVFHEINAAKEWSQSNPSRRKTKRGIRRFLNAWLSKAHKLKGSPFIYSKEKKLNKIEESMHDISWVDKENRSETSKWYIKNKGFYYLDGKKYTEPYGIKKVVNISDKSKNLKKNKS